MTTTTTTMTSPPVAAPRATSSRALLGAGIGSLLLYVAGMVVYGGGPGADDVEAAAAAIERTAGRLQGGVLLIMLAMVLGTGVVAALSRAARPSSAGRLVLPLGVGWLLMLAAAFAAVSAAASVDRDLFDAPASPAAATAALVAMNALMPLASLVAAGFLVVTGLSVPLPGWLRVTGYVFAVGLVLPPVAWAVLYLLPLWLAAAAVVLARRG